MFNPRDIIEILAGNVKQTKSPFGIPKFMVNTWFKDVNLPEKGEYLLFTGLMYQFTPFIEKSIVGIFPLMLPSRFFSILLVSSFIRSSVVNQNLSPQFSK